MAQLEKSPAAHLAAELADTWQRFQNQAANQMSETIQAIQSTSTEIWPWISKVAETAGKTLHAVYR
jgi:hypothetical protein